MIVSRSPLRISLGGGGTDLPSYYENHSGYTLSAAIDKYVYVGVGKPFYAGINLKYSKNEVAQSLQNVNHPIIREAIKYFSPEENQIEIVTFADVPAGTGLGSSGAFTAAILCALSEYYGKNLTKEQLAKLACEIEINRLNEPIGKQDQYTSVFGGLIELFYEPQDIVICENFKISQENLRKLTNSLLLYFTGTTRSASKILKHQNAESLNLNSEMNLQLHNVKELGHEIASSIKKGDITRLGYLMNQHWRLKLKRANSMSSNAINSIYDFALNNSAIGGKIVGAGGGGFLMFVSENPNRLRKAMKQTKLLELPFNLDYLGTSLI